MEQIFRDSIEEMPLPVICFNETGEIIYANNNSLKALNADQLIGKNIRGFIPVPETKSMSELIEMDQKLNLLTPVGEVFYDFLLQGNSKLNIIHAYGFDVTELKRKEHALSLALQQIEEIKKMDKDFLAKVSHEIRSPLLVIEGFTELLISEVDSSLRDEFEPFFYAINNSGKRLIKAFDLVLNNYQLHTNNYEPRIEKINLRNVLAKLHKDFYSFATEKNVKFTIVFDVMDEPIIEADLNSVEQIFSILINNAFGYTLKGKIGIRVYEIKDRLFVDVLDTGTGIPDELFGILNRFFSGEHKGSLLSYEVTGLGLETIKMFCDLIKAEVNIKTEYGQGSVFTVSFKKFIQMEPEAESDEQSNIYYLPSTKKPGNF